MLPGFRFLFAAIVLSMSILVFGLGAAALLRAAHEEFASNPSWHAPPETMFAQAEATSPVLGMLRIEPPAAAQKAPDNVPAVATPAELAAIAEETSVPEAAKSDIPVPESRAPSEATSAQADAQAADTPKIAADAETNVASTGQALPPAQIFSGSNEAVPIATEPPVPEQMSTQASPEIDAALTKIATLGGPPVTIGRPPANAVNGKPDGDVIKKRLQARRAAQRRRVAARARLAAQQAQQQSLSPFGLPPAQPPAAARR